MLSQKRIRRKTLQNSDPGKILNLVMSLEVELCSHLQNKINSYLKEECEAELVLMVVVHSERLEAYVEAVGITPLSRKIKIEVTPNFAEMLKSGMEQFVLLNTTGNDFQAIVKPFLHSETKLDRKIRLMILPFYDKPFSILVCVVAPKVSEEQVANLTYECFLFVWPTMKKAIAYEYECTMKQKCQHLLRVAKRLFSQVASLDTLLQIAMVQAKSLVKAEYCTVKLLDLDRIELAETKLTYVAHEVEREVEGRRFPLDRGIAGVVIKTGTIVNLRKPKEHPEFSPEIDSLPGVECKTLLCFPIREQSGIIGVGHLINKVVDPYFDVMDEEMALAFSIYCGVCIVHSVIYQKVREAHIRNALAHELIMYHMKVGASEIQKMLECTGFHGHPHIVSLHFNNKALPNKELPCYILKMFSDLGFNKKFHLKLSKLACFILHVQKGYRDVPYHNWHHAFNVAQWAYAALVNYKLAQLGYLTDLQAFMYVLAALVHDLDHRGTTNSFQIQGQTNLAALYSSEGSVMERHHLSQAMCILNTEGCDILESLPRRDYDRALVILRDYVLATDIANYFKNLKDYKSIALNFIKNNRAHNSALMALLMNGADLSDQLKDWGSVKKTAASVLTEFFKQGDIEKSRGELPVMMMDRDKCFIPVLECNFLKTTCIPLFETFSKMIPKAAPCIKILENHIERWDAAIPIFAEVPMTAGLTVLMSPELDNLIELQLKEKERLAREAEELARLALEEEAEQED
ncbi:cGMP-dependent 3',5'-cyclic phosphodiesterase-like [Hyposmocoma kahamanoa]|uniref:cGMP-dependent 3',5'-cyclic phosphodiesterase-like n=1 Tax=Hyposmocoma kahamanoa TaxID=1477025 RepID=UPI000E6D8949|nr:cGMP-dependent 3',5'-cyclic phosphodiesterase-like [Hyposmocoma kahamanoa]